DRHLRPGVRARVRVLGLHRRAHREAPRRVDHGGVRTAGLAGGRARPGAAGRGHGDDRRPRVGRSGRRRVVERDDVPLPGPGARPDERGRAGVGRRLGRGAGGGGGADRRAAGAPGVDRRRLRTAGDLAGVAGGDRHRHHLRVDPRERGRRSARRGRVRPAVRRARSGPGAGGPAGGGHDAGGVRGHPGRGRLRRRHRSALAPGLGAGLGRRRDPVRGGDRAVPAGHPVGSAHHRQRPDRPLPGDDGAVGGGRAQGADRRPAGGGARDGGGRRGTRGGRL
ncbi:MAG: hypothetical protein AVDCRST_MAG29-1777, partial [uncultured Nocardioidaceae bacterium]